MNVTGPKTIQMSETSSNAGLDKNFWAARTIAKNSGGTLFAWKVFE